MTTLLTRIAAAIARENGDDDLDAIPGHKTAALKAWQKTGILREEPFRDDYIAMAQAAVEAIVNDRPAMEAMAVELCGMYGNEEYWDTGPITRAEWMNDCQHLLRAAILRSL